MHAVFSRKGRRPWIWRIAVPAVAGTSIAAIVAGASFGAAATSAAALTTPVAASEGVASPRSFADLAERVTPTVVNISAAHRSASSPRLPPQFQFPPGSPFEQFFREFFRHYFEGAPESRLLPRATATGSGFIIDPDGLIVTNHHVIRVAEEIRITLQDGRQLEAELQGVDEKTDLALLSVDAGEPLPYAEFGDSDAIRVGDWVIAVGNPFGFGGTVTAGIVSARGRDIRSGTLDDFLQIDAPINRGSSGGPLFDASGRVVGVNTAIFSPSGGNVGIGFAIPSRQAQAVIDDLATVGRVERGWLGVHIQRVSADIAKSLGLEEAKGALVAEVAEGGPAETAGLGVGDVILEFAGNPVPSSRRLPRLVAQAEAGERVEVVVFRDGKRESLSVVVGQYPDPEGSESAPRADERGVTPQASIGLEVAPLTIQLRADYEIPPSVQGVLVVEVDEDGAAAQRGLRVGDVIVRAGDRPVSSPADVSEAIDRLAESGEDLLLLLIEREGARLFVAVPIA